MTEIFCLNKRNIPSLNPLFGDVVIRSLCNHGGEYGTNPLGDFVNKGDEKGISNSGIYGCAVV
jgi:hypothetical protein